MMTTATHNAHDTTTERVLCMAFELSGQTWKLGFTQDHQRRRDHRHSGVGACVDSLRNRR
jgi:hypothetical protein